MLRHPSIPCIEGARHIPDSQAQEVFTNPEKKVLETFPFSADSFHIDDVYSPKENRIFVDGHIENELGFHHTIFDIKRPGALRRCFAKVLNKEPQATVSITQYDDLNPSLPPRGKRRYSDLAVISAARKANALKPSRSSRETSPLQLA